MPKSVKDCLIEVLEDLDDEQVKKFKSKLVDRKEEPRIRKGTIQHADRLDLADKLVSTFTEENAGQVTIAILNGMDFTQEAKDLRKSLNELNLPGKTSLKSAAGPSAEKHFLDIHRIKLTERVSSVDPIMDRLLDKGILNSFSYSDIAALPTDQKKMRALYNGPLMSCGNQGKDEVLLILEELQPFLIKELKDS